MQGYPYILHLLLRVSSPSHSKELSLRLCHLPLQSLKFLLQWTPATGVCLSDNCWEKDLHVTEVQLGG